MVFPLFKCQRSLLKDVIGQICQKYGIPICGVSFELMDRIEQTYNCRGVHCRRNKRSPPNASSPSPLLPSPPFSLDRRQGRLLVVEGRQYALH